MNNVAVKADLKPSKGVLPLAWQLTPPSPGGRSRRFPAPAGWNRIRQFCQVRCNPCKPAFLLDTPGTGKRIDMKKKF